MIFYLGYTLPIGTFTASKISLTLVLVSDIIANYFSDLKAISAPLRDCLRSTIGFG